MLRIRLILRECVGPERPSQFPLPASVVTTGAVYEVLFSGSIDITGVE